MAGYTSNAQSLGDGPLHDSGGVRVLYLCFEEYTTTEPQNRSKWASVHRHSQVWFPNALPLAVATLWPARRTADNHSDIEQSSMGTL